MYYKPRWVSQAYRVREYTLCTTLQPLHLGLRGMPKLDLQGHLVRAQGTRHPDNSLYPVLQASAQVL